MIEHDPFPYFEDLTQAQIGKLFRVSSQEIGRWLIDLGVRDRNGPSSEALASGLAKEVAVGDVKFFGWNKEKVVPLLERAGHQRPGAVRAEAVETSPALAGPFTVRRSGSDGDGCEIVNSDGTVGVWVRGQRSAERLVEVMNVAHRFGKLG